MPSKERTKPETAPLLPKIEERELLHSWGEIAAFLGMSISFARTAHKFRGLPVAYLGPKTIVTTKTIITDWIKTRGNLSHLQARLDRALYSKVISSGIPLTSNSYNQVRAALRQG